MKLKFLDPRTVERNVKATIHRSGKLGFTIEAAKKMNLETRKGFALAINEDDPNDKNFYAVVYEDAPVHALKVLKAGDYYYLNTKDLFDNLNLDYTNNYISFDIVEEKDEENNIYYKLKRTEKKRTQSSNQNQQ